MKSGSTWLYRHAPADIEPSSTLAQSKAHDGHGSKGADGWRARSPTLLPFGGVRG